MAEWISPVMGSDANSDKLWRSVAISCIIAAVTVVAWSRWVSLALGAFGIGAAVAHWLKRSGAELPGSAALAPSRSEGAFATPLPTEGEFLGKKVAGRTSLLTPSHSSFEEKPEVETKLLYTLDKRVFRAPGAESSAPVVLPQNSIRLAADNMGAGRKKSFDGNAPGEVIDRSSIMENFEKRYRIKRDVPPVEAPPKPSRQNMAETVAKVRSHLEPARGADSIRQSLPGRESIERQAPAPEAPRVAGGGLPVIPPWSTVAGHKSALKSLRFEVPGALDTEGPLLPAAPQKLPEDKAGMEEERLEPPVIKTAPTPLFDPEYGSDEWLPPLSLLHPADSELPPVSQDDLIDGGILIEEKLAEFRVRVNVQDAYAGPVITRYEIQPAVGVRGGQVVSLVKDLARALGLASIRVVETIPGKTCMGLELPNAHRQMIRLSEVLSSELFGAHESKLAIALGKDIIGRPVVADLAKAPHLLVAGTTGSGKSVGLNAMILSLLYRVTPAEVRFVMIDPKMLELSIYDGIAHLLAPVVTDMKLAANALNWCVWEMERRYRLLNSLHVRNLAGFNQKVREGAAAGQPLLDSSEPQTLLAPLPYIVVVVDELADLMMSAGKKI